MPPHRIPRDSRHTSCVTDVADVYSLPIHVSRYKEAGPSGQAAFEAGVEGFEARSFRGCGVVTSDPFEVSDGKFAIPTQVGLLGYVACSYV